MIIDGISFRNYKCFKGKWAGFKKILPINIIIGDL